MTMSNDKTNIDPRYLKYNKDEVESILDNAATAGLASEVDVRAIVSGSLSEPEPDPQPNNEPNE